MLTSTTLESNMSQRFLCIPVQSTYECKTRGEVALWATRDHQEVRAEKGVARCGGDVDARGGMGAEGCACALIGSFFRLQKVRLIRKTRNQFKTTGAQGWTPTRLC
jgi:hypothetical protein